MLKKVLFVDDDRILRSLIHKKLEKYKDSFEAVTAEDGLDALKLLEQHTISLVITDLQMPKMDGFALLVHLSEKYPDIPVIIQTGHSTAKSKKLVLQRGAVGYIEKPFKVEDLAAKIIASLEKQSEGGTLQTIPLEMFIQLIEMEQKTCTIRVINKSTQELGVLFFRDGDLMEARLGARNGKQAAYEIFSWDQVTLAIQDECAIKEKRIQGDLQAILFDAMRMKDEAGLDEDDFAEVARQEPELEAAPAEEDELSASAGQQPEASSPVADAAVPEKTIAAAVEAPELSREETLRNKLKSAAGEKDYVHKIYTDKSWNDLMRLASKIGILFQSGALKSCYIEKGEATDLILLPGEETTVLSVDAKCPRDRILQALALK